MEHSYSSSSHGGVVTVLYMILMMLMMSPTTVTSTSNSGFGNETDRLVLLDFKKRITGDPLHIMSSWNESIHFCNWVGVTCNNHSTKRVLVLNLDSQKLAGSLPLSIGNLTHLTGIDLTNNSFHGEIPQQLGRLRSLRYLNLTFNSFGGTIPANISHCTQLRALNLDYNEIIGSVPNQLSSLLDLQMLSFYANNLSGSIPAWIGNFSSLRYLYFTYNNFEGSIPNDLGRLTSLESFALEVNNLSGMIPSAIYNISSINRFGVTQNQLHGELPPNVGITLPNLQTFFVGGNKFTGTIPPSFSNASTLRILEVSENGFTGTVPGQSLGRLQRLVKLNLASNRLGSGKSGDLNFINSLANCTSLQVLVLNTNFFGGELPASIANLSTQLTTLALGGNFIQGTIPVGIGSLMNLIGLGMETNFLGGSLPHEIGKLQKLQELFLGNNTFTGSIPSTLGNLTSLAQLSMEHNSFEGSIPPSLANCQNLQLLDLSSNNLTRAIPQQLFGLSSLSISLSLSKNSLTGSLPFEVGQLTNLAKLDVSRNNLSGQIPKSLGSCTSLMRLHLEVNQFHGGIPQSFKNLKSVEEIDISSNNFSGKIPTFLGKFRFLKLLNLSHNDFDGEVLKEGIFSNASGVSILGNNKLCGGIPQLHLPICPNLKLHSSRRLLHRKVVIPTASALAFIIALSCFIVARSMVKKSRRNPVTSRSYKDWKSGGVSYLELVQSTDGFSSDNIIGSGSFGSVYKGIVPGDGKAIAIKVLNLQHQGATKSFIDECKALRSIRHRNLLKIVTVCSSIDNQGNDFKSLVFEFMTNGSLGTWLHPSSDDEQAQRNKLSLIQRLNIAIDVASAIDYLHHGCERSIVHCDLKPSNILLDEDMVAHVGDFGLATFLLDNSSHSHTMSARLKGSIGYIPPEYGMGGQVSVLADVYSFGILLLEMFTGKRPTDDMFGEGLCIHQFTARAMPDHAMDIADPSFLIETDDANADDDRYNNEIQERAIRRNSDRNPGEGRRRLEECLVSVMQIGLSCSATSPTDRMLMDVVVNKMKAIRDSYLNLRRRRGY